MTSVIVFSIIMRSVTPLNVIMLSARHYTECKSARVHAIMLTVISQHLYFYPSAAMLCIMFDAVMKSVIMRNFIVLSVCGTAK